SAERPCLRLLKKMSYTEESVGHRRFFFIIFIIFIIRISGSDNLPLRNLIQSKETLDKCGTALPSAA
ncbi:MAG: hypothetical protein KAH48_05885, partial [Chlorobi bacterium]|nr:hypothetical protein [Chlorobiota bacterium]